LSFILSVVCVSASFLLSGCSNNTDDKANQQTVGTVTDPSIANKPAQNMGDATGKIPAGNQYPNKMGSEGPTTKDNANEPGREKALGE